MKTIKGDMFIIPNGTIKFDNTLDVLSKTTILNQACNWLGISKIDENEILVQIWPVIEDKHEAPSSIWVSKNALKA